MRNVLTRNIGWKLLSLVIAVALWVAVAREPELATSLTVPIEFKNIPEDLDMGANVPERVHIEVRGPSGRLSRENLVDAAMVIDLSDAHPGERTYTIHQGNVSLPSGVVFYRAIPSQLTLRFERLMSRLVPIEPFMKPPPEGYRVREFTIDPQKVRLRGPEEHLRNIARVMTDPVDLSGVVGEAEFHTHVNVGDGQIRLEVPTVVTLKVTLEKVP